MPSLRFWQQPWAELFLIGRVVEEGGVEIGGGCQRERLNQIGESMANGCEDPKNPKNPCDMEEISFEVAVRAHGTTVFL